MPVWSDDRLDSNEHEQAGPALTGPARAAVAASAVTVLAVLAVVTASFVADHRVPPADGPAAITVATAATSAPVAPVVERVTGPRALHPIRGGSIDSDWQDWSWAAVAAPTGRAPDGTRAVPVTFPDGYGGLSLRQGLATRPEPSAVLRARVWVEGAATWLGLTLQVDDGSAGRHGADQRVPGGRWVTLSVPVGSLGAPPSVKRLTVEHRSAELRDAHRSVRIWVSDFSLS